jgi:cobalt-zinc-cadmium resistance protein CzcA
MSVFSAAYSQPLSLSAAIDIGLKNNPGIKAYTQKVNASKGRFLSGVSLPQPELSVTNDYVPQGRNIHNFGEQSVGISQSIEFPITYFFRGSKYSIEREIAENDLVIAKLGVIFNIKKSYFNVLARQEQMKIARENLVIAQDFVKKAEMRYSVGECTNLEKLTAKINYTEVLNAVEIRNNHLSIAIAELNSAMGYGKNDSKIYFLTDELSFVPLDLTPYRLLDISASVNPLLKADKLRVDSYSADKSIAWSSILPNFNLAYFNKQVSDDSKSFYGASISIGIPIWFMLDQSGKIQEASSNLYAAKSDLQTTSNEVYAKTQAAFAEFKHAEKQVLLFINDILPQAEEICRTAAKSYEAGEITYMEYLQAQQTLTGSKGSCVDALLSYNLSIVTIEETIGKTLQ